CGTKHLIIRSSFRIYYIPLRHSFASCKCKQNEEISECSAHPFCQKRCDNIKEWERLPCPRNCVSGCVCKDVYVLHDLNVCIKKKPIVSNATLSFRKRMRKTSSDKSPRT
ncbi:PREDICTED: BMP-binding endothelial regulator protein-like, partial [Trachymyrmex cornetzi]|uniref:BMP-binding endothelial regulator protein-like n=1 Tax=Trachymyrmex cornetzi TaxID=471704 RepID=UPI00084F8572